MKILVCGDAMEDVYWTGSVSRLSPEAPVPVVSVENVETRGGGAANVANTIEALGVECVRVFGPGEDIRKIRLMAGKQHVARIDFDYPQQPINPDGAYAACLRYCDIVVFIDYGKGSLANVQELIAAARARGCAVLVDPKGGDYAKYRGATMIKPNEATVIEWASIPVMDYGFDYVLCTRGAAGMTLYSDKHDIMKDYPAENAFPVDVSGAGEAAIAAYAAAMAKGMQPVECARYASKAAGIACAHQGTYVVKAEELWD